MAVAIHVESLGKRYRIGERLRYLTLRDRIAWALRAPVRMLRQDRSSESNGGPREIWALRDTSFEVQEGEVVGLIGRNGAGKTTLLKLLSRVTLPSTGWADIRGRVGSLLEVGTGFHPELTGRENVFLNGAILGMGRREIAAKFDEIVAFGEVEDFIDTPVKHYSTGMQMRLAFAVAAHFEPQILLVDEVLAVGDLAFQKKCLGKMDQVAQTGRTILFVSHQMNQIRRLCQRVIWIDRGGVRVEGRTAEVINAYEKAMASGGTVDSGHHGSDFVQWEVATPENGRSAHNVLNTLGTAEFRFSWPVTAPIRKGSVGIVLRNHEGQIVWATVQSNLDLCPGRQSCSIAVPFFPVVPGTYYWSFALYDGHRWIEYGQCFPEMSVETPALMHPYDHFRGFLNIPYEFRLGAPQ